MPLAPINGGEAIKTTEYYRVLHTKQISVECIIPKTSLLIKYVGMYSNSICQSQKCSIMAEIPTSKNDVGLISLTITHRPDCLAAT